MPWCSARGRRLGPADDRSDAGARRSPPTAEEEDLLAALVGDRYAVIDVARRRCGAGGELVARVNGLAARGASRLVISIGGDNGAEQEKRVKDHLLRLYPRHLLGAIPLLFSWELVADRDDARRTWSALLNAFLHPAMERFLFNAESRLRESPDPPAVADLPQRRRLVTGVEVAALKTYSSGPRGGLEGTRALAGRYGLAPSGHGSTWAARPPTSAWSRDGAMQVERRGTVEQVPSSLELAAITSYGVGGSSVIRVIDGELRVGPDSVGAAPGRPASGSAAPSHDHRRAAAAGLLDPATYLGGTLHPVRRAQPESGAGKIAEPLGDHAWTMRCGGWRTALPTGSRVRFGPSRHPGHRAWPRSAGPGR